jgi:hypothetical protein
MNNLKEIIAVACDDCGGAGFLFYGSDEEYSVEPCSCVSADEDFTDGIMGA